MIHAQQFPELPLHISGWTMAEKKLIDSREALYDYIDGGAELYISYGFKCAITCRYTKEGQPEVTAEIFDMGSAPDAFGVYSQTRDKEEKDYGQGSYYINGAQFFWKDKYWVSLVTGETTEEAEQLLHALAGFIDEHLKNTGEQPAILSALPAEGLVPGGYLYFHHYIWLNSYYFIASENILGVNDDTPAVLAKYGPPEKRLYLLLIQYPDTVKAEQAFASFGDHFFPEGLTENTTKMEDDTWMAAGLYGNTLAGVFNAENREMAINLLEQVKVLIL
ncbi:MAG: hypothetical protein JW973_02440 [Bacteroidales bacterium]|nr:hypothetical protein [Bacteroidales bacterium]